jgi:hypothetical protein
MMEIYYPKRYHRILPGQTTGTLIDRIKLTAEDPAEAETSVGRKFLLSGAKMDWEKDFALQEDATGEVIAHGCDEAAAA